jgi:6-phosphogluconolactonase
MEILTDTPGALSAELLRRFETAARSAIAARGRFSCVLPGGSVARTFFPQLATAAIDWARVDFFWGDERAVPTADPESNYGLAQALWLDKIAVDAARVHRMRAESIDLDAAAAEYARRLEEVFGGPPRFDCVLLGVGSEGHVCSLFPGHAALRDRRWAVAVHDSPKPPPQRITLTLAALAGAATLYIGAFGEEKAAVVAETAHSVASTLPVALAARAAQRAVFLVDHAAARGL